MSQTVSSVPPEPVEASAPFHDHRWHQVVTDPDTSEIFLCDECGVIWTI